MEEEESIPKPKSPRLRKRNNLPRRAKNMSKEQLLLALKKKKECNAKAQGIVLRLIDFNESHDVLVECLKEINQCHYQDVIEERAITKICGFPLCNEPITELPAKQYHISTKTNKVYDLTERKNFCSGKCFRSSNYLKEQMLTSPLWLRDQEDIPEFKLLSLD